MPADNRILTLGATLLLAACTAPQALQPRAAIAATVDTTPPKTSVTATTVAAPQTAQDLWSSLRQDFALPQQTANPRIRRHRDWYVKHPRYLKRVSQRARHYAWYIHRALQERGMPAEIALLPIVESAYDPFAYSHGRAAGLWQFIPSTGKRFGLKQNWWFDGRRDVPESTRAALDYLQYLHKRFDGDWLLALAAYNSGEGTVMAAQRYNRKKGRPTGFWDLKLPRETSEYVPKLIALGQLVRQPEKYGVRLPPLSDEASFRIVETGGQIDLAVAAELADIDLETLYRLNPGFNQWATAPKGPHRLLVPTAAAATFRQAIAQLPPDRRIQWERVKIRPGETLSEIAKHYHTTVNVLVAANQLHGSRIRAGRHLVVPVASKDSGSYILSAAQRLHRKQNHSGKGYKSRHVVRRGDTLWDLSREYKVGVRALASWNGMAPGDPLRVGQSLVIWSRAKTHSSGARVRSVHYTVRRGDSLSRIAERFKVNVSDLRRWNDLPEGKYLQPGQPLKLYVDVTRQTGA